MACGSRRGGVNAATAADGDLLFSNQSPTLRLFSTGICTLSSDSDYRSGTATFGRTFSQPPIVHFAGVFSGGARFDLNFWIRQYPRSGDNNFRPAKYAIVTRSAATFYIIATEYGGSGLSSVRYFVFENTIQ